MKPIYLVLICILCISSVSAFQSNTSNNVIFKTSLGSVAKETNNGIYIISSELGKEIVFQNTTTRKVCNGFYCLWRDLANATISSQPTGPGGGHVTCPGSYKLTIDDKYVFCITKETLAEMNLQPGDYSMSMSTLGKLTFKAKLPYILGALFLIVLFFWFFLFYKRDDDDDENEEKPKGLNSPIYTT